MSEYVVGHSEFTAYPAASLSITPRAVGLPGGAVSFEHLALQTRARREGSSTKCEHGFWLHQHDPCPWCFGVFPGVNDDVVQHKGEGNGWMLRDGQPVCMDCGGPAISGYRPSGMTPEQLEHERIRPKKCHGCALKHPEPLKPGDKPGWEHVVNGQVGKTRSRTHAPFAPDKERF